MHRLRDQDPRITPALTWLDQHLAAQGSTADTVVHDEHQRQGAGVVTVRNIITSMRMISDVDWPELFERVSLVDDVLAAGSAFRGMDFPTRNLYRSAIEELSRGADRAELDVAPAAVQAANARPSRAGKRRGRSPQRSRLPPSRRRTRRVRGGDRLPAVAERVARTPEPEARHRRLRRRRDSCGRRAPRHASVRAARSGSRPGVAQPARCSGVGAGYRCGGGGGEPLRDARLRRNAVAALWNSAAACPRICAR